MVARKIFLEMTGVFHSYYRSIVENPPAGYTFTGAGSSAVRAFGGRQMPLNLGGYLSRIGIPIKLLRSAAGLALPVLRGYDLVITNGLLDFRNESWMTVIEEAHSSLLGLDVDNRLLHPIVEKQLSGESCKGIIIPFQTAKKSIESCYDTSHFKDKFFYVPPAVKRVPAKENGRGEGKIVLTFVSSSNFNSDAAFYNKGGHILLKAYRILKRKYPNLQLKMRCKVPAAFREATMSDPSIRVYSTPLSQEQYSDLLWSSDIFVLPCIVTPWMTFLDAMNHELPTVTTPMFANTEVISHGRTGVICYAPECFSPIIGNYYIPNRRAYDMILKAWRSIDTRLVNALVDSLELVIRDPDLRIRLGKAARQNVEANGKYSIETRNMMLKLTLDAALAK